MMIFKPGREQPVPLTDAHGVLYVDNGDGTVTLANDQDGERDTPWGLIRTETTLHTTECRRLNLADTLCPGDEACVADHRACDTPSVQAFRAWLLTSAIR